MVGVSFIVCTHNGESKIRRVVEAIKCNHSKHNNYEIILVDNNSTDKVVKVFLDSVNDLPHIIVHEKKQGLVFARIAGVDVAKYEWIVFVDDDNYLDCDIIEEIFSKADKNANIGAMGGVGILEKGSNLNWFNALSRAVAVGPQAKIKECNRSDLYRVKTLFGACLCIRKEILVSYYRNGYSPVLTGRKGNKLISGEDSEICEMVKNIGFYCVFNPNIKFSHDINMERIDKQYFQSLFRSFGVAYVHLLPFRFPLLFRFGYSSVFIFLYVFRFLLSMMSSTIRFLFKNNFSLICKGAMYHGAADEINEILNSDKLVGLFFSYNEFIRIREVLK
ncbi:glycosyltransferase family 2 protein [Shewanella baltica]|uniref:glycosyltransferase family 2 protein n=1 Tax=Shewanella baltica TaxID=62322 RepID=UPI00217E1B00|nr:glycosyltransferase family 2 protein [Shewanella baltica]MCS6206979.1 glycosyltransferase family 2 protein [Shewanella baltica]